MKQLVTFPLVVLVVIIMSLSQGLTEYSNPWFSDYYHNQHHSSWYPIENPYQHAEITYPPLTPAPPLINQEIVNGLDYYTPYANNYDSHSYPAASKNTPIVTNIESPDIIDNLNENNEDLQPAESSRNNKFRQPNQRLKKKPQATQNRGNKNKNRYYNNNNKKRRRVTTTTPSYYYDSYEDYEQDSYEDSDDYYDSVETTTRYYSGNKRRRKPTPPKNKNRYKNQNKRREPIEFDEDDYGGDNPVTEIVIVRQAQVTTTEPTTLITNGTTTTETPTTTTTTTNATTGTTTTLYGYGPSQGNENISITYGPPFSGYQVPHFDWYTQESARNAIVKRVREIVAYNHDKK